MDMEMTATRAEQIAAQLTDLLCQVRTDQVPLPADGDLLLRDAGLSSLDMVTFLVLIEDHFGITFDDDLPEDTLRSLNSIARYLADLGA
jgi:acyl carrier protein